MEEIVDIAFLGQGEVDGERGNDFLIWKGP